MQWTQQDLMKYQGYINNISYAQIAVVGVGGIYEKGTDIQHTVAAYLYRIYDKNDHCPDRNIVTSPGAAMVNGIQRGLILMLAKDGQTGSFYCDSGVIGDNIRIAHPAVSWMAMNYSGVMQAIANAKINEHQALFHKYNCVKDLNTGAELEAFVRAHMEQSLLPYSEEMHREEIFNLDRTIGATL